MKKAANERKHDCMRFNDIISLLLTIDLEHFHFHFHTKFISSSLHASPFFAHLHIPLDFATQMEEKCLAIHSLSSKVSGSSNKNVYEAVQGMENNGRSFL
jgi:hypothetical protein